MKDRSVQHVLHILVIFTFIIATKSLNKPKSYITQITQVNKHKSCFLAYVL